MRNLPIRMSLLIGLLLISPSLALGWGGPHHFISQAAVEALPQWQQDLLKEQTKFFVGRYCMYPDVASAEDAKPYIMPDAKLRLHIPETRAENQEVLDFYLPRVEQALKEGKLEEGMKWFGSLTHYLEDSSCPAHVRYGMKAFPAGVVPMAYMEYVKQFMEVPPEKDFIAMHPAIDVCGFTLVQLQKAMEGYKPRLMGLSVPEVLFHLGQRHEDMITRTARQLIPMMQAYYKDDMEAFAQHGLTAATEGAQLVADLLFTMLCLSQNKIEQADRAAVPTSVSLADLTQISGTGFTWDRMNYQGRALRNASGTFRWASDPADLKPQPLELKMEDGTQRVFEKGYGVGMMTEYTFLLQPGVFKTFTAYVGNHARIGMKGTTAYQVLLDGKMVAETGMIKGDQPCKQIKVELGQAGKLTIRTTAEGKAVTIHGVWGEPTLSK